MKLFKPAVLNPALKSAAAAAAALAAFLSRFLHFARRFLNQTWQQKDYNKLLGMITMKKSIDKSIKVLLIYY